LTNAIASASPPAPHPANAAAFAVQPKRTSAAFLTAAFTASFETSIVALPEDEDFDTQANAIVIASFMNSLSHRFPPTEERGTSLEVKTALIRKTVVF
jgi:hypothetical protein